MKSTVDLAFQGSRIVSKYPRFPASNSTYGASNFVVRSLAVELEAHGVAGHLCQSLVPVMKYCIDSCNTATNDFITVDALLPVGWLVIAEKERRLPEHTLEDREKWKRRHARGLT